MQVTRESGLIKIYISTSLCVTINHGVQKWTPHGSILPEKKSLNDVDFIHTACVKLLTCAEPKTKASFSFRFSNFFNLLIYNGWSISALYYYAMGTALLCFRITMRMIFEKIAFQFISTYFSLFQHVSSSFIQFDINSLVTNLFIFTFVDT